MAIQTHKRRMMILGRIKYLTVSLLGIFLYCGAMAQGKGEISESLSAAWAPVEVEHHFGIRGGYAMGTARFEPTKQMDFKMGLIVGGLVYKFDVPSQKYVGCIETNINWSQKGYVMHESFDSDRVYERKYNTIEIPILWQPYMPLDKKGSRFHLSAGPYVSYAFNSTYRDYNTVTGEVYSEGEYEYDPSRDNRWEYGLSFGAGILVAVKRFSISIEARYNISLSDTFKGVDKYEGNPFRSSVDQINLTMGLNYKLKMHKD